MGGFGLVDWAGVGGGLLGYWAGVARVGAGGGGGAIGGEPLAYLGHGGKNGVGNGGEPLDLAWMRERGVLLWVCVCVCCWGAPSVWPFPHCPPGFSGTAGLGFSATAGLGFLSD